MTGAHRSAFIALSLIGAGVVTLTLFVESRRTPPLRPASVKVAIAVPAGRVDAPEAAAAPAPRPEKTAPATPPPAKEAEAPAPRPAPPSASPPPSPQQSAALPPLPTPKARAVEPLLAKARSGDAKAQHELALAYASRGDHKQSAAWFREAAIAGLPEARLRLAEQYRLGRGVPADPLEAFIWAKSAAEKGLAEAQLAVGDAYERGAGVPAAPLEAFAWYAVAAQGGSTEAGQRRARIEKRLSAADRKTAEARASSIAATLVPSTQPNRHLVAEIQRLLRSQGYDPGLDDGFRGERTADAIRRYQQDKGMTSDGMPSEALLGRLRRAVRPPPPTAVD